MKNMVLILLVGFLFISCSAEWEYKTVSIQGNEQKDRGDFGTYNFSINDTQLNTLGNEGWEMVGIYEKVETVHPNFGNVGYVTGLQPNVRTSEICFVFKRKK